MTAVAPERIMQALAGVMDPELKRSLVELGMVRDVRVQDGRVSFTLALTTLECPRKDEVMTQAKAAVLALDGVEEVAVDLAEMSAEERQRIGLGQEQQGGTAEPFNDIRRVIAVMSGKGGVGKSLVTALLAVALRQDGQRVGILDADVTGPSIPKLFGLKDRPAVSPLGMMPASSRLGTKTMSINLILPNEDEAENTISEQGKEKANV